ncbi:hypothetical protein NKR23_g5734 [Pleurostoma richardsiae]|uniref:Lignostilbene dioxygenase n=1 Tax=Pleurostoma richardsiae TaxID=41990 RepID=A0AA38RT73_9PEZI|nr:hypothetical protein NKR23_g5734 [Pleurostoma richardsiae]
MSAPLSLQKPLAHLPDRPQFSGFMKPCRLEGEVSDLEVYGEIPPDIDGTFYRCFNGDGNISAFRIKDGRASFRQRYVRTEKLTREREVRRALLGRYRSKYTDAVELKIRTTANTNVVHFNGRLLALKEDAPPYSMDPETLETHGLYTFDGQLPSLTSPPTRSSIRRRTRWSASGMRPGVTALWTNSFPGHTANAYEDVSGNIIFDLDLSHKNVFWWPDAQGNAPEPSTIHSQLTRFIIDPRSSELDLKDFKVLQSNNSEFYRVDDRFKTQNYRHCYFDLADPALGTDFPAIGSQMGGGYPPYNALGHFDLASVRDGHLLSREDAHSAGTSVHSAARVRGGRGRISPGAGK